MTSARIDMQRHVGEESLDPSALRVEAFNISLDGKPPALWYMIILDNNGQFVFSEDDTANKAFNQAFGTPVKLARSDDQSIDQSINLSITPAFPPFDRNSRPCHRCLVDRTKSSAVAFCIDCRFWLCTEHLAIHNRRFPLYDQSNNQAMEQLYNQSINQSNAHACKTIADVFADGHLLDAVNENVASPEYLCLLHHSKLEMLCKSCNQFICWRCSMTEHSSHSHHSIDQAWDEMFERDIDFHGFHHPKSIELGHLMKEIVMYIDYFNDMEKTSIGDFKACIARLSSLSEHVTKLAIKPCKKISSECSIVRNNLISRLKPVHESRTRLQTDIDSVQRCIKALDYMQIKQALKQLKQTINQTNKQSNKLNNKITSLRHLIVQVERFHFSFPNAIARLLKYWRNVSFITEERFAKSFNHVINQNNQSINQPDNQSANQSNNQSNDQSTALTSAAVADRNLTAKQSNNQQTINQQSNNQQSNNHSNNQLNSQLNDQSNNQLNEQSNNQSNNHPSYQLVDVFENDTAVVEPQPLSWSELFARIKTRSDIQPMLESIGRFKQPTSERLIALAEDFRDLSLDPRLKHFLFDDSQYYDLIRFIFDNLEDDISVMSLFHLLSDALVNLYVFYHGQQTPIHDWLALIYRLSLLIPESSPYWPHMIRTGWALKEYQGKDISLLAKLRRFELPLICVNDRFDIDKLLPALKSVPSLKGLCINAVLEEKQCVMLSGSLKHLRNLQRLDIKLDESISHQTMTRLMQNMRGLSHLTILDCGEYASLVVSNLKPLAPSLIRLQLSFGRLSSGNLSTSLVHMTSLTELVISECALSHTDAANLATSLPSKTIQSLSFSDCTFPKTKEGQGMFDKGKLDRCQSLKKIVLQRCSLGTSSQNVIRTLSKLPVLQSFSLSRCPDITNVDFKPMLQGSTSFKHLDFASYPNIDGTIIRDIVARSSKCLLSLVLPASRIINIPAFTIGLSKCSSLARLDLSAVPMNDASITSLCRQFPNLKSLQLLFLAHCGLPAKLSKLLCRHLRELKSLRRLSLSHNDLSIAFNELSESLVHMPYLNWLFLESVCLTSASNCSHLATGLSYVPNLLTLFLSNNCISDQGLKNLAPGLAELHKLRALKLDNTGLGITSGHIISSIFQFTQFLRCVTLSSNSLCDQGVMEIAERISALSYLIMLDLDSCMVGDKGMNMLLSGLVPLKLLKNVNVRDNSISEKTCINASRVLGSVLATDYDQSDDEEYVWGK